MRAYSIIVSIIALMAILGLVYFYRQSNNYQARITELESRRTTSTSEVTPTSEIPSSEVSEETATPQATPSASNLLTYSDSTYGFSFQYPSDVKIVKSKEVTGKGKILSLVVEKINAIEDLPSGWDKETALRDKEALARGDVSVAIGWPLEGSQKIVKIPSALAKKFMTLSSTEVCDVQFTQIALIYKNDYRIVLKLVYEPDSEIVKNNPKYFTISKESCGDSKVWKDQKAFYEDLLAGKTDALSQSWYKAFETILSSFKFNQS